MCIKTYNPITSDINCDCVLKYSKKLTKKDAQILTVDLNEFMLNVSGDDNG